MSETTDRTVVDGGNPTPGQEEQKTFTQDELNRIISERLNKERSKLEADVAKREQELHRKEFMLNAGNVLRENKLPVELLDALNTSSEEAFGKSVELLLKYNEGKETRPANDFGSSGNFGRRGSSYSSEDSVRTAMGLQK